MLLPAIVFAQQISRFETTASHYQEPLVAFRPVAGSRCVRAIRSDIIRVGEEAAASATISIPWNTHSRIRSRCRVDLGFLHNPGAILQVLRRRKPAPSCRAFRSIGDHRRVFTSGSMFARCRIQDGYYIMDTITQVIGRIIAKHRVIPAGCCPLQPLPIYSNDKI